MSAKKANERANLIDERRQAVYDLLNRPTSFFSPNKKVAL
jgi:hypothetical protein